MKTERRRPARRSSLGRVSAFALLTLLALIVTTVAAGHAAAARSPTLEPVDRPDDELVILELRLGRTTLHDGLPAFLGQGILLLPFTEITAALEFPIEVDVASGVASGWFLHESRRFSLDLRRGEILIEGHRQEFDPAKIELHHDDIYVDLLLLERWFPVDLEADLLSSRLLVQSREKLPLERKLERQQSWNRLPAARGEEISRHPDHALPYRLLDWPALEHRLRLSFEREADGRTRRRTLSNLVAVADFLHMSAELALGIQEGDVANDEPEIRFRLGRADPEGRLLGPLRATEVELGDIVTPQRPLVSGESFARGFEISNFPLGRPEEFDRTTLRGDALPGWDVELYHNEELIDFQTVGESGHYEFTGIPLYVGLNLLRVVLYGPHGEERQRLERILIDPELIRAGQGHYRFAVHQQGLLLFRETDAALSGQGIEAPVDGNGGALGEPRFFAEYERGLRHGLGMTADLQSLPVDGERHTYLGLGLLATFRGIFHQFDLVGDLDGGWAARIAAEGDLGWTRFRIEHRRFFDFVSEEVGSGDPPLASSVVQLDSRWRESSPINPRRWPLRLSITASHSRRRSGNDPFALTARLSTFWNRLSLTHGLELREEQIGTSTNRHLTSSLLLAARFERLRLRAGSSYVWRPRPGFVDLSLTADWRFTERFTSRFHLSYSLEDDQPSRVSAGISRRFRTLALGADFEARDDGAFRARLSLSLGLMRDPHHRRFRPLERGASVQGALAARVFLDQDLDQRFDPLVDEPLEHVELEAHGGGRAARTDADGIAVIEGLEAHRRVAVSLDEGSLEDPFWVTRRRGLSFVPRRGRVLSVDFPITPSGEIDGTVYLEKDHGRVPVSRVELELIDEDGEIAAAATTAYDGFYLLMKIPPGRYHLRLSENQRRRLDLRPLPPREILIGKDGTVVNGVDFILDQNPSSPEMPRDTR